MNRIVGHQKVHVLSHGWALCLFSKKIPGEWPSGHLWTYETDACINATCIKCLSQLVDEAFAKRLYEKVEVLKRKIALLTATGETFKWDPRQKRLLDMLAGWSAWLARDPHGHVDQEAVVALYQRAGNLHRKRGEDGEDNVDVGFAIDSFIAMDLMPVLISGKLQECQPSNSPSASPTNTSTHQDPAGAKAHGKRSPTASSGKPKRGSRR